MVVFFRRQPIVIPVVTEPPWWAEGDRCAVRYPHDADWAVNPPTASVRNLHVRDVPPTVRPAPARVLAEPLLRQVVFGTPEYIEAKRLLSFLQWFLPIGEDLIPDNSLLREFIGGSILKGFTLWQNGKNKGDYGPTGVLSELNC